MQFGTIWDTIITQNICQKGGFNPGLDEEQGGPEANNKKWAPSPGKVQFCGLHSFQVKNVTQIYILTILYYM